MPKTIVVTGASSGIGKALSIYLAKQGHHIVIVARNEEALNEMHRLYPNNTTIVKADITKDEDRLKVKNALPQNIDGVYLVHNAGIATPCLFENLSEEEWDKHYLINTKAPLFLTKLLIPHLENGGRVLNISTGLAHHPLTGFLAYGVTKSALYMMKEYFNSELKSKNISFGSAMPGIVDTPIQDNIRSYDPHKISTISMFQGFKNRDELLSPTTAAKFLAWVLLESDIEKFISNDWDIYNTTHQNYWAQPGDIKERNKK